MQTESADWDVERRQRAERHHVVGCKRNFFVRFPERRLLKRFARVDDAAGQRHLTAMPLERIGTHRQDDMGCVGLRSYGVSQSVAAQASVWRSTRRGNTSRSPAASRIRAGLKPAGHSRRGRGASAA